MKLLWNYLKNYKKLLAIALVLATTNQLFSLLDPQIFRYIIDNYATQIDKIPQNQFLKGVGLLLLATMGVAFISRIAKNFQDYFVNVITQRLGARMYNHSVEHSFSLPFAVFEDQRSGEFLNKLQKARNDSQLLIGQSIGILFLSLVGIIFVIGYAFFVHWSIGVGYILIIPILGTATYLISKKIKGAQEIIIKETSSLAGSTTETLRNVELVKSLGLEQQEITHLNTVNETILQLELKKIRLIRKFSFIQGTLINALRSVLMLLMLWLVFTTAISLGEFFTLLFYSFMIFNPLSEFGNLTTTYQETKASMERLEGILNTPKEPKPENPVSIGDVKNIAFNAVSFKYESGPEIAVNDININICPGDTVAFVGPSGSGKTTLIKLLVGLYKPTTGKILINGTDNQTIDIADFRKQIGLVSQDTQLFAGTIRENLLFASPDASDADCLNALKAASATTIIERGGQGLETKIGEGGLKLSGGEKQRLAIARALLRDPDLIIFDEATSSLDSLTEEEITATIRDIEKLKPGLITVLVAHRLSTIIHAKNIFVLEKGKIVEQGSHSNLLEQKGLYAALWRQQIASRDS
ncbi:MAG: ABC transporter ATP-binding protein [Candidatus Doudnabacteria bacterium]|nr:ABC transporter ATP-binding protein [Candidatus Doudnabacteria bacterium]